VRPSLFELQTSTLATAVVGHTSSLVTANYCTSCGEKEALGTAAYCTNCSGEVTLIPFELQSMVPNVAAR
jgi:hypothetical protein